MATMMIEKQELTSKVDARSGFGFTLGLILGAAAGGLFSLKMTAGRDDSVVPPSAIDLGRKVEQLRALETTEDAE